MTDNRVDLHELRPSGASFQATREPFLSGPDDFRPVHFSYSSDGRFLYFTDWVKISYPVHGFGRIWRVELKTPVSNDPLPRVTKVETLDVESAFELLGSSDASLRTRAIDFLSRHPGSLDQFEWDREPNPMTRAHFAIALKRTGLEGRVEIIPRLLSDADADVRFVGIKWIADEGLNRFEDELRRLLGSRVVTRRDLRAGVAALAKLGESSGKEFSPDEAFYKIAMDFDRPANVRALCIRELAPEYRELTVERLEGLMRSEEPEIREAALRSLVLHPDAARAKVLARIAAEERFGVVLRCDAIAGLAAFASEYVELLDSLAQEQDTSLREEAARTLASAGLRTRQVAEKPELTDLDAWMKLIRTAEKAGDFAVGRRIFFHDKLGGCYKCHEMEGRGQAIGPDLSTIKNQSDITEDWLLEHVVNPNAEMAPYYRPQQLLTVDGDLMIGLVVGREGGKQAYVASDGKIFYVDKNDIEERRELQSSIMPNGLLDQLTAHEIRSLFAYLLGKR